jgi:two-component system uhpT operon response regulator UhpA
MTRPRVVIAEDFVLLQEMVRDTLEPACEVIATAEDGQSAIEAVTSHRPDILLVDVSLPVANGFLVTERVRQTDPEIKIIFVTAYRERSFVDKAFELGAKGYVLKSSIRTELLAAIRQVMGGGLYRSAFLA